MLYLADLQHHPWEDAVRLGAVCFTTGYSEEMILCLMCGTGLTERFVFLTWGNTWEKVPPLQVEDQLRQPKMSVM